MPIYFGSNKIKEIYNGSVPIKEVYNGSNKVFGSDAVIEYGEFNENTSSYPMYFNMTFLPDFETSTDAWRVAKPSENMKYVTGGVGGSNLIYYIKFLSYSEKSNFQAEIDLLGVVTINFTYKETINLGGAEFHVYSGSVSDGSYTSEIRIPKGFVMNKSWFLEKYQNVSRDSDLSFTIPSGNRLYLKSRYKVNLSTGEEQLT